MTVEGEVEEKARPGRRKTAGWIDSIRKWTDGRMVVARAEHTKECRRFYEDYGNTAAEVMQIANAKESCLFLSLHLQKKYVGMLLCLTVKSIVFNKCIDHIRIQYFFSWFIQNLNWIINCVLKSCFDFPFPNCLLLFSGMPAIIVIISAAVRPHGYGTDSRYISIGQ